MGGDRHNNVVDALFHALPRAGVIAHRFDFTSSDLAVAVGQTLEVVTLARANGLPTFLVGYSFGGAVASTIDDDRVAGWFLVAPALSIVEPTIGADPRPKGIVAAEHDQLVPPDVVEQLTADWVNVERDIIVSADHLFRGRTASVVKRCGRWIRRAAR
jgi:alpha/beta superfamily hydrolase